MTLNPSILLDTTLPPHTNYNPQKSSLAQSNIAGNLTTSISSTDQVTL